MWVFPGCAVAEAKQLQHQVGLIQYQSILSLSLGKSWGGWQCYTKPLKIIITTSTYCRQRMTLISNEHRDLVFIVNSLPAGDTLGFYLSRITVPDSKIVLFSFWVWLVQPEYSKYSLACILFSTKIQWICSLYLSQTTAAAICFDMKQRESLYLVNACVGTVRVHPGDLYGLCLKHYGILNLKASTVLLKCLVVARPTRKVTHFVKMFFITS